MNRQDNQQVREGNQNIELFDTYTVEYSIPIDGIHGFEVDKKEPQIIEETPGVFVIVE